MRGRTLPVLNNTIWQKSLSYVQVNIYGTSIKGLRDKGVDIKHLLQHVGCRSVVMDVPILDLESQKSSSMANMRRTKSMGGYCAQPRPARSSCSTKTVDKSKDREDSKIVYCGGDCEGNALIGACAQERGETPAKKSSSVASTSYSGATCLSGDDIIFHDCFEEFMEDSEHTFVVCDPKESSIPSNTSANKAAGSKLFLVGSNMDQCDETTRFADDGKETCVASLSDSRNVEHSSAEQAKKFTSFTKPSANLNGTTATDNNLQGNFDEVKDSTLLSSCQEPPGVSHAPYEEDTSNSLQIVGDECTERFDEAMQVETDGVYGVLHTSASEIANLDSSHCEGSSEQTHSYKVLKSSPPSGATNECYEIGANELSSLFDKENVQKSYADVASSERAVKCGKRKRPHKPSSNSQNSLDDGDDDEEQRGDLSNTCKEPKAKSVADTPTTTSQVFHCQMPDCGKSLCYRQRYGKHRLVNHVRTHWRKPVKVCRLCGFTDITTKKIHDHHMKMHKDTPYPGADSRETKEDLDELLRLWNICFPDIPCEVLVYDK
ncbi:hypothetical protein ANCCAN_24040 [Ancylostoma caninum]|uniref:C2H2-type domain-containing protein n=1 Tax=Ancylostoma caninum TaxID=29170 RepID=A0A368FHA5_ANCCA|nr:hypothetical protein ANCCAN_24040 [Ancylostoma caninum]